jgi:hypothetical protein
LQSIVQLDDAAAKPAWHRRKMSFLSRRVRRASFFAGLVGMSLVLGGCGGGDEKPAATEAGNEDRIDFVLGPNTKQLSDADLSALHPGADTSQTLRFEADVLT